MVKFTETDLVENKELRAEHLERVEVLDKAGKIILFPNTELMTTKLVSRYYEIELKTLQKVVERHRNELELNGMAMKSHAEIKEILKADNVSTLEIPRRGTYFFTKRAVLNIGMLLTESTIALEVRNQILNGFEQLSDKQIMSSIEEEKDLVFQIYSATDDTERMIAISKLNNFKNRHIEKLNEMIEEQKPKVESFDTFIDSKGFQRMNDVAKALGVGRNKLFAYLREIGILMKDNSPYQKYINQEYFVVKESWYGRGEHQILNAQTFVTAKGVDFISKKIDGVKL